MYYKWEFKTKTGEIVIAKFTDAEIRKFQNIYPEVRWIHTPKYIDIGSELPMPT